MAAILVLIIAGIFLLIASAYLYYKYEFMAAVGFLIAAVVIFVFSKSDAGLFLISPILFGCVCGYCYKAGKSLQFYLLVTSLTLSLIFILNFYIINGLNSEDILVQSKSSLEAFFKNTLMLNADKKKILID